MLRGIGRLVTVKLIRRINAFRSANKHGTETFTPIQGTELTIKLRVARGRIKTILISLSNGLLRCRHGGHLCRQSSACTRVLTKVIRKLVRGRNYPIRGVLNINVSLPNVLSGRKRALICSRTLNLQGIPARRFDHCVPFSYQFVGSTGTTKLTRIHSLRSPHDLICLSLDGDINNTVLANKTLCNNSRLHTKRFKRGALIPSNHPYCYKGGNYLSTCYSTGILSRLASKGLTLFFSKLHSNGTTLRAT